MSHYYLTKVPYALFVIFRIQLCIDQFDHIPDFHYSETEIKLF
jgi:hypothetical protein